MNETKIVKILNYEVLEVFEILIKSGAKSGDLVFDMSQSDFHPVYKLGTTNICFEEKTQSKIHKIVGSSRKKDNLPFKKD